MDLSLAHIHLMINHIPVLGAPFLAILLILGLFRKSPEILRAGVLLTVVWSLATVPVYLTGEPAEHQVEDMAWADEDLIHRHEERAEKGFVAALATGAFALILVFLARGGRQIRPAAAGLVLLALLVCSALFGWTALAGGEIRHEEIRVPPATATPVDADS